jgi:hypothetical protein
MKINDRVILLKDIKDSYSEVLGGNIGIIIYKGKFRRNYKTKNIYHIQFNNGIIKEVFKNSIKKAR